MFRGRTKTNSNSYEGVHFGSTWLLALTQGFLRMCRALGWHGRLDQADGGRAFWSQDKKQEPEREESMANGLY